jgi:hypothetical protein
MAQAKRRDEPGFQGVLRFFHRGDRRLVFVLGRYRLRPRQSRIGIAGGLTDSLFELSDIGAARSRLGKRWIEAEHRTQQESR